MPKKKVKKLPKEKVFLEYSVYSLKPIKKKDKIHNYKSYVINKKNKDGSYVSYGISKRGHRFYKKSYRNASVKLIEKTFYESQKKSNRKVNNVTLQVFNYYGKVNLRTKYVTQGQRQKERNFFKVTKQKGKKSGQIFTIKPQIIIDALESFREIYDLKSLVTGELFENGNDE